MEYIKDFDQWNELKKRIDGITTKPALFKEGEIWWASVGINIGYEEDGKSNNFARPVVILRKFNSSLLLGAPLTSNIASRNYFYKIFNNISKVQ